MPILRTPKRNKEKLTPKVSTTEVPRLKTFENKAPTLGTVAEKRATLRSEGKAVALNKRFSKPSGGGKFARDVFKSTQLPALAASVNNLGQIAKGEEKTDLRTGVFGDVEPLGKGFDVTSFDKESVKGILKAGASGLEASSFLVGGEGLTALKASGLTAKQALKQIAVKEGIAGGLQEFGASSRESIENEVPLKKAIPNILGRTALGVGAGAVLGAGIGAVAPRLRSFIKGAKPAKVVEEAVEEFVPTSNPVQSTPDAVQSTPATVLPTQKVDPNVPQPVESPLATEARKFKTAEEFIKSLQKTAERINNKANITGIQDINYPFDLERNLKSKIERLKEAQEQTIRKGSGKARIKEKSDSILFWEKTIKETESEIARIKKKNLEIKTKNKFIRDEANNRLSKEELQFIDNAKGKTKEKIIEIWNKAQGTQEPTPNIQSPIAPETPKVGTTKVSKVAQDFADKIKEHGGDVKPSKLASFESKKNAVDYDFFDNILRTNPKLAEDMISGKVLIPEGRRPNALLVSANRFIEETGRHDLLEALSRSHLTANTSEQAGNLQMLNDLAPNSPLSIARKVTLSREANALKNTKAPTVSKAKSQIVNEEFEPLRQSIKRPKRQDLDDFIRSIPDC